MIMKRLLLTLGLLGFLSLGLRAQDISADERKRAADYLKKTSTAFLASTKGLSEAQLKFKSDPTRWSVAECAEHITASESFLFGMIQEKVMTAPARSEPVNVKEIDDFVLQVIPDRSKKATAPEPLVPKGRFGSVPDTMKQFAESRAKTTAFLNTTKDLRQHAVDSPLGKKLDAYQWVLFIAAHSERHTKQILEVKADPNFPKK
jgi:hypothetical protein